MPDFDLVTDLVPRGDQPAAIDQLRLGLEGGRRHQVLLGVTGSGKTFSVANVIARAGRPTLVIAPNKTLAAQLYQEFREFFPGDAVEYFVSYYDYYQPEAYLPTTDTYIEKDALVNDTIDRLRHAATRALLTRRNVIIVASVSCIYGIGSAEAYYGLLVTLERGARLDRDRAIRKLVDNQYTRNDHDLHRGTFRVRGDVLEVVPAAAEEEAIRIEWFGDEVERILTFDVLTGEVHEELDKVAIFPASHYVTFEEDRDRAMVSIRDELRERLQDLRSRGKLLEAQRLEQRTIFDLEMLEQTGHCRGIENYSRHLTGRSPGEPPPTLMDYFPGDYLLVIDESHVTVPQIGAMWRGDRSRKESLVEHGFRLPSALDNRPLTFAEFEERVGRVIYVSATPADHEIARSEGWVAEQIIRPTGLLDPEVEVRPVATQVDDVLGEIRARVQAEERVLVTTLTKRLAEHLTEYYQELGVRVRYMHSDIDTLERMEIVRQLREGVFDVLVGINLLREGLDLPEVSLVAILDADKEGFLRSARSLIQTIGRASRNLHGKVIMYGDRITRSMREAIDETERRREKQAAYNREHGISPRSVKKAIRAMDVAGARGDVAGARGDVAGAAGGRGSGALGVDLWDGEAVARRCAEIRQEMWQAAQDLDFEQAAALRDQLRTIEEAFLAGGVAGPFSPGAGRRGVRKGLRKTPRSGRHRRR